MYAELIGNYEKQWIKSHYDNRPNKYHQNVVVTNEHGVSYAAADAGAFALNDCLAMYTQDAYCQGSQLLLRSALSYDAAARASNGKKAFAKATSMIVENMVESMASRLETSILYGQSTTGLATGAVSASGGSGCTFTCTAATWAPGIWAGKEKARVWIKVSSTVYGPYAISALDFDNRVITVVAATESKGQDAGAGSLDSIASQATAYIGFWGSQATGSAGTFREMIGLDTMIGTSGTLFNIDNSVYSLWKASTVTTSGQLTMGKIINALGKPIAKGLDEDVIALVGPDTWSNLASDLAALRKYDGSYKPEKGENGFESLEYFSQNGKIEVISHSMVKAGDCFVIPPKRFKRVGAIDVTFKTPGREEEIFFNLPDNAGFELRCYTDQALFPEAVAKCLKITGFTNV